MQPSDPIKAARTMDATRLDLPRRPRRLRRTEAVRALVRESRLNTDDFVMPLFVTAGEGVRDPIHSMPGQFRLSLDTLLEDVGELGDLGIRGIALFPVIPEAQKDPDASEALNPDGLYPRAIRALKDACPDVLVVTDVALDPYSSDGHDGLVRRGEIHNDSTLAILADMALVHAEAGADFIAPSDMMDGRVKAIRTRLDAAGFTDVGILAYTAKYASTFYGPFRDALDSAPRENDDVPRDKKTYQMDTPNVREAMREAVLDISEGADILMVKPGLPYLDVVRAVRDRFPDTPLAVYNVSGEYAMVKAAAANGWLDERAVVLETLGAFKRAGADIILTYHARDAARWLRGDS